MPPASLRRPDVRVFLALASMTPPALPASLLTRGLWLVGLACLALITVTYPGATRMYAWPWTLALAGAVLAPGLLVITRAFSRAQPLVLPRRSWCVVSLSFLAAILLSALVSPHRGPSLLWSAPLLSIVAWFFAFFDWLHRGDAAARSRQLLTLVAAFLGLIACFAFARWLENVPVHGLTYMLASRNPQPLGHSNYTAGLGILLFPIAAAMVWQHRGAARVLAVIFTIAALGLVFSSGSRGGWAAFVALLLVASLAAPIARRTKLLTLLAVLVVAALFVAANPRLRSLLGASNGQSFSASDTQRSAMFSAGWRMASDRPLLGWGPGTTPLVYPRYRAFLDGGAENVLQLHNSPIHLGAELGLVGLACGVAAALLALPRRRHAPVAILTLIGYGVFSVSDWQLDVPVFAAALAALLALSAASAPAPTAASSRPRHAIALLFLVAVACITLLGHRDPTPELNVRALALAPAQPAEAIRLLRESLRRNPHQELPHTNLGWLLVTSDPAEAARHFRAAAHFVPDKGGIYFGLGLSALNQANPAGAARAFALECLNDPTFLTSPYWREPAIAATRAQTAAAFTELCRHAASHVAPNTRLTAILARLAATADQLGRVPEGPERTYRRQRGGYPVLTREPDLPAPLDVFVVREIGATVPSGLPPKGWLPSPVLLTLLDASVSVTP